MGNGLPVSARLAWWGTSWLSGRLSPDDLLDGVLAGDVTHLVDVYRHLLKRLRARSVLAANTG